MSIVDVVTLTFNLCLLIKQASDEAETNLEMCKSLSNRVQLIPRLIKQFHDINELDEVLIMKIYSYCQESHRLINKYRSASFMTRLFKANKAKGRFEKMEHDLSIVLDDLALNISINSATKLESICVGLNEKMQLESAVAEAIVDLSGVNPEAIIIADDDDNESNFSLMAGFGEMADEAENLILSVKLFQLQLHATLTSSKDMPSSRSHKDAMIFDSSTVVLIGDKLILKGSLPQPLLVPARPETSSSCIDDDEHDIMAVSNLIDAPVGTIIFHIDCTTSMKREDRMIITKNVLCRVLPDLLRQKFKIIVNSWASNQQTKGKIQSHEIKLPNDDLLEKSREAELLSFIEETTLQHLVPDGKTDLFGSIFQLLNQCRLLGTSCPVYAFILTDGTHNRVDPPHHSSRAEGEDYFGLFRGKPQGKWEGTGRDWDNSTALEFLSTTMQQISGSISITLIGIGDAKTTSVQEICNALGPCAVSVGITNVDQSDAIFKNLIMREKDLHLVLHLPDGLAVPFTYTYQLDSQCVHACVTIAQSEIMAKVHRLTELFITISNSETEVSMRYCVQPVQREVECATQDMAGNMRGIPSEPYQVSPSTLQAVFKRLLLDKRMLNGVKSVFYSKNNRKIRAAETYGMLEVWMKQLEHVVESQITSYRMNVETELLRLLESGGDDEDGSALGLNVLPSEVAMERLRNNVKNYFNYFNSHFKTNIFHFLSLSYFFFLFLFMFAFCILLPVTQCG